MKGCMETLLTASPLIYCFFPFCSVGGAEKVHLDILKAIKHAKPRIFIRYKSNPWMPPDGRASPYNMDTAWLPLYKTCGKVTFLSDYIESLHFSHLKAAWIQGKITGALNAKKKSVLFFWNDPFAKTILPGLKPHVKVIDIVHNHKPGDPEDTNYLNIDIVKRVDKRILAAPHLKIMLKQIYEKRGLKDDLMKRIHVILNGAHIPDTERKKNSPNPLKVIFVARDTHEKRIHLINSIAGEIFKEKNFHIVFNIVGPDSVKWNNQNLPNVNWLGLITEEERISEMYAEHHVFLLTSYTEGMPKTMIEAMANRCVPVVAAVGAIPEYISDGHNGFLLPLFPEEKLISEAVQCLKKLFVNPVLLEHMSNNAYNTAKKHFDINLCEHKYRRIIVPFVD